MSTTTRFDRWGDGVVTGVQRNLVNPVALFRCQMCGEEVRFTMGNEFQVECYDNQASQHSSLTRGGNGLGFEKFHLCENGRVGWLTLIGFMEQL